MVSPRVNASEDQPIELDEFQKSALLTDQNHQSGVQGINLPMLGFFGEVGSLLSELKKKQRDKDSYVGYRESVIEEFGDVLWYFSNIASRAGFRLCDLAQKALDGMPERSVEAHAPVSFVSLQRHRKHVGPVSSTKFEEGAINLGAKAGGLLQHSSGREQDADVLFHDLKEILRALISAADDADISLQEAASMNIRKRLSRWPVERTYPPLFDCEFPSEEQLPRKLKVVVQEKTHSKGIFVLQQVNGVNIGDRLTDNVAEADDYRFHDVFHWTYAAVLGWSPVTRALLRLKRKSNPVIDENEDGARAQLIEEGVATWIFQHGRKLNFYENISTVDYQLLKSVQDFIKLYEVKSCPLWLWEEAILGGFRAFRFLRQHRRAILSLDLETRKLDFNPLQ